MHGRCTTHLLARAHTLCDPRLDLRPSLVDRKEARLSTAFDQLVGLDHKWGCGKPGVFLLDFGESGFSAPLEHVGFDLPDRQNIRGWCCLERNRDRHARNVLRDNV